MKIILIASVSNLGKIGDVIEVKDGFAKNFLIPNNKAISYSENNAKIFESRKKEFEKLNQENLSQAEKIKERVSGKDIIIIENASDDGRLYGSVTTSVIADKINEIAQSKTVVRNNVSLEKPIKMIGVYEVNVELHSETVFGIRVVVSRTEAEVQALLNPPKEEKKKVTEDSKKPRDKKGSKIQEDSIEEVKVEA